MPLLFEYGKWESIKNKNALKQMLKDIWEKRLFVETNAELTEEEKDSRYQPFLQFYDSEIKANNFVGFIQNGDEVIEIYPKVFRNHLTNPTSRDKKVMLQHIFYWFNYCRKWKFPFNQAALDTITIDKFPELIINLIANQFLETISNQPLTMYQEVEEALATPRGSINFKRYLNNSLAHGNFQEIECDYEPFLFDNKVNRVIKYCSRLLLNQTQFSENIQMLQEIIFILDEVEDLPCTTNDISKIHLNSFFDNYSILLDSCKLILSQQLYSSNIYDLSQWCLLFPMEYIFEDFVAGFLERNFSRDWRIHYQKSEMKLATDSKGKEVFKMQHDIFLTHRATNKEIIIDTKYKIREQDFKQDNKKGIAQNDLYQMTSYAFKRGCTDVILVYPNLSDNLHEADNFVIASGFDGKEKVNVSAIEIPFWTMNNFNAKDVDDKLFKTIENNLNRLIK
ncbi:MAG: restriction endonuclease [Saprospiraceae bacterium]|nr:restriction endonuclease [Saprospiraceae bacterium]